MTVSILTDLQTRTVSESSLLALVELGADADVARWYNEQAGTPAVKPTRLTKDQLQDALGLDVAAGVLAKLRGVAGSESPNAPILHEVIVDLDARGTSPDLGDETVRGILDGLVAASAITPTERDALKSLAMQPQSLAQELFGRSLASDDVSAALSPVRVGSTAQLIPDWQAWTPEEAN